MSTEDAGGLLIIAGIIWIFLKTLLDHLIAHRTAGKGTESTLAAVDLPKLEEFVKLLNAPYGVGIAMIIIGATLLLAGTGVSFEFGDTTRS